MECGRSRETVKRSYLAGWPNTATAPATVLDGSGDQKNPAMMGVARAYAFLRVSPEGGWGGGGRIPARTESARHASRATLARWCRIRSYLNSATAHGITALKAINRTLTGKPWLPPLPALA